jgi:hypothetical protein
VRGRSQPDVSFSSIIDVTDVTQEEDDMLTLTERAATELRELLEANDASREQGIKLCPDGRGGVQVTVGTPDADDEVLRDDGRPLLIIDTVLSGLVDGATLDTEPVETDGNAAVRLRLVL